MDIILTVTVEWQRGLGNIQKLRDGESLGGRSTAADDFQTEEEDDFLA